MKAWGLKRWVVWGGLVMGGVAMGTEEAAYTVEKTEGEFQVRQYAPQVVAETLVEAGLEDAGNQAFRVLFRYISGENRTRSKIAMTAPVGQQRQGEKIAMTAPVSQERAGDRWAVSFMMPSNQTLATLPEPADSKVSLRAVPARRMAVVRYSGVWSQDQYDRHLKGLRDWAAAQGLKVEGEPVWARYNPPFTLWFLRRNEIWLPVQAPSPPRS